MRLVAILRLRLRTLFLRKKIEEELDEELRYHLDREREALAPVSAGLEQRKEECRDTRGLNLLDELARDTGYAARGFRRNPGFAFLAVFILALGIGANTAVFSVVNGVLLKPLAYRDPDRVVTLTTTWKNGARSHLVTLPDVRDWQTQSDAFEAMAYYRTSERPTKAGPAAEYVGVARVSEKFFDTLGVAPVLGRLFSAEEQKSGDSQVALISYSYWQSHWAGTSGILGQRIQIGDRAMTIVGVLPPRFHFPDRSDVWVPADAVDRSLPRTSMSFLAIARLKSGVRLEEAQAQLASIARRLARQYPESNKDKGVAVTRMRDDMVRDVRFTLYLLLGAVCLVLLIACANVATLLLGKAAAREREMAIRAAIGARRSRLVRQLITESLLLALLAGATGFAVAVAGSKALIALAPMNVPRLAEAGIDSRVLAFTIGVSILCSLLFGLVPALYASRIDLNEALKRTGSRSVTGGGSGRLRGVLVIAEIAFSVVLLAFAGLLVKSFVALNNAPLGFRPERVLAMKTSLPGSGERARKFFRELLSAISLLPGVSAAGATMEPPGQVASAGPYWIDRLPAKGDKAFAPQDFGVYSVVTPRTFAALGISLKRGRDFGDRDLASAPFTVVINEALARKISPERDPIGRILFTGFDSWQPMKVIGVVGDVRQSGPARKPDPEIYMPYEQHTAGAGTGLTVVVRTVSAPEALTKTLEQKVHELSADAPVRFTTLEASLYEETAAPRFRTLLLGVFAGISLCLAMAGVYGVTAYGVSQRSNEIGVRMAMGATPAHALRLVLRHGAALAAAGMTIGFLGSLGGTRLLTSMLFEVSPSDPATYAAVAVLLGLVVLLASYLPARKAAKLDPVVALRQE